MTESTLSKALYKAQKFGAQYAWQRPLLKGKSRDKTWGSWFCRKEIQQWPIFSRFKRKLGNYVTWCVERYEVWVPVFVPSSSCVNLLLSNLISWEGTRDSEYQSSTITREHDKGRIYEVQRRTQSTAYPSLLKRRWSQGRLYRRCDAFHSFNRN